MISLDTLRPDHLGVYGNDRAGVSPELDRFARESVRFDLAISQAPWTTPSHMSLMTSQYPSTHGVNEGWTAYETRKQQNSTYRTLPDSAITLAEVLRGNGYATFALAGGVTIGGDLGFSQGFDVYDEGPNTLDRKERLAKWLETKRGQPFFAFLHSFEVHAPYNRLTYAKPVLPPTKYEKVEELLRTSTDVFESLPQLLIKEGVFRREVTTALYDGGVHRADDGVGWVLEQLDRLGFSENTIVVLVSDHGEEFGEHDRNRIWDAHCATVYDELIRVPLIIRTPGGVGAGSVVRDEVEMIDVAPTILDFLGIAPPPQFQGQSLEPLMQGESPSQERWALSEATCSVPELKSLRSRRYKYIAAFPVEDENRTGLVGEPLWEKLFDLQSDPGEQRDVSESEPDLLAEMRARLGERMTLAVSQASGDIQTKPIDPKRRERLRSLGYIQ